MGRLVTIDEYLNSLSERVIDNTKQLKRDVHQRRNGMEDLYGVCFSSNGDANTPATFYVSLSPDYVYLERFAFKFVIKPFSSSVAGVSGGSLTIGDTTLTVSAGEDYIINGTSTLADTADGITPNPHNHSASGSLGGINYGVSQISTTSTNWHVLIGGVDITAYLIAQHDGQWINGQGIFPNANLGHPKDFYDILEVCDVMTDEGKITERDAILSSAFKKVEISSDAPFGLDAYLYLKYPHSNR